MPEQSSYFLELLYRVGEQKHWVQQSPVLPNVWKAFIHPDNAGQPIDLLLTPQRGCRPAQVAGVLHEILPEPKLLRGEAEQTFARNIAFNQSIVAASVTFDEMIQYLVPLSKWCQQKIFPKLGTLHALWQKTRRSKDIKRILEEIDEPGLPAEALDPTLMWWVRLVGSISLNQETPPAAGATFQKPDPEAVWNRFQAIVLKGEEGYKKLSEVLDAEHATELIFQVSLNRTAQTACEDSIRSIKADAAGRVFSIDTSRITWAILDTGVDALHEAFQDDRRNSRVRETYDFTKVRQLIALASAPGDDAEKELEERFHISRQQAEQLRRALTGGGEIDWESVKPALRVGPDLTRKRSEQEQKAAVKQKRKALEEYAQGLNPHGTHVAGILAGKPKDKALGEENFRGVCPGIKLIDVRILDQEGTSGAAAGQPEFNIIAALQFVGYLNTIDRTQAVHGINLSVQLQHDPEDYACGRTPICEECNRLVANGVVVVAAAGNLGIDKLSRAANTTQGAFQDISIADPGNAESVITVGSTHRAHPHTYGVSFFSSRGPTGDGRLKPDLVAPGEKILGPVIQNQYDILQGTSQAAPHVSGAAAMLLARHNELIGNPDRVKEILCGTATDLGRDRQFQGAGLVDILRALQSV